MLNTFVFVFSFIIITDLFTWRAIRYLMRNRSKAWRRTLGVLHFGLTFLVIAGFLYFFSKGQAERYDAFRIFFSGLVLALYVS
jgi:hypothetical protein